MLDCIQSITKKTMNTIAQHKDLTDKQLEKEKVPVLRKIARDCGVEPIMRDGEKKAISYMNKKELLLSIREKIDSYNMEHTTSQIIIPLKDEDDDRTDLEYDLDVIADKIYNGYEGIKGLKDILIEIATKGIPFHSGIATIGSVVKPLLESLLKERVDNYSNSTLISYKVSVVKRINNLVEKDFKTHFDYRQHLDIFTDIVNATFISLAKEKVETTNTNLNTRQSNVIQLKIDGLIHWSKLVLSDLTDDSSNWKKVAIALMFVTGRRSSEIMSSGEFEYVNEKKVLFSGQLKRHEKDDVLPFEIPTLVDSKLVIDGLEWLKEHGKRSDTPKKAHTRFSRYLNEEVKYILDFNTEVLKGKWEYERHDGKMKSRKTIHILRQIYAQVAYEVFTDKSMKIAQYLTDIMGHSSAKTSINWAATNYDSDIDVVINDSVKELIFG